MAQRLLIATRNSGKLAEFTRLLRGLPFGLVDLGSQQVTLEVRETGATYKENAVLKAVQYSQASGLPTLADDSGLEVDALGGAPGLLSARFGGPGLSDADRVNLMLERMSGIPDGRRTARFVASLALAGTGVPSGVITVEGAVEGLITRAPAGSNGFGYDPVFWLQDSACTMAELSAEDKDQVSHRGRATRQMVPHLLKLAASRGPRSG